MVVFVVILLFVVVVVCFLSGVSGLFRLVFLVVLVSSDFVVVLVVGILFDVRFFLIIVCVLFGRL